MKKSASILWRAFLVAVVLFLVAAASAPFILERLFPPDKVRALVAKEARQKIDRDVKLGGVGWSLIHGVTIKDFAISEKPDFSAGTFISLGSLSVRVRLVPLMRRHLVVASLEAQNPEVNIIEHKNGFFNFSDIFSTQAVPSANTPPFENGQTVEPGSSESTFSYGAREILISGGRVEYRNESNGQVTEVSNFDADIRHFQLNRPFPAKVSASVLIRRPGSTESADVSFDGDVGLGGADPRKIDFKINSVDVGYSGWKARLTGDARNLESPKVDVKLNLSRGVIDVLDAHISGDAVLNPDNEVQEAQADVSVQSPGFKAVDLNFHGLPPDLRVAPLSVSGKIGFADGAFSLRDVEAVSPEIGNVKVDGTIGGVRSGQWNPNLNVAAELNAPRMKSSELFFLSGKLPAGAAIPAFTLDARGKIAGADAQVSVFNLKTDYGTLALSGVVKRFWSAPAPNLNLSANLKFPELRAEQMAFLNWPQGFVLPPSHWSAQLRADLGRIDVKSLEVAAGGDDLQVSGHVVDWREPARSIQALLKCRRFVLAEISGLFPSAAPYHLTGDVFFVLAARGPMTNPFLAGKMKFINVGGHVSGLAFSRFDGIATFDDKRIDIPDLSGNFGSGKLKVNLTIDDYTTLNPAIDMQAELDKLDLGSLLDAMAEASSAPPAPSVTASVAPAERPAFVAAKPSAAKRFFARVKGQVTIGELAHPNIKAEDLRLYWDLSGIGQDVSKLNGWARVKVSSGRFDGLGDLAEKSKVVKVLTFPFLIFQKIGSLGGIRLFPSFDHIAFSGLNGDYAFQNGVMTVKDSRFSSAVADLDAKGTVNLPAQTMDLNINTQLAKLAPFPLDVKGTFDHPKVHVRLDRILLQPAQQLLRGLLGH